MLMIEASRSLGLAARFASGYLAIARDETGQPTRRRGATHAWAQIYVPGVGWIDFDPTRGSAGNGGLVTVAVVRNPRHATPLRGTFVDPRRTISAWRCKSALPPIHRTISADRERSSADRTPANRFDRDVALIAPYQTRSCLPTRHHDKSMAEATAASAIVSMVPEENQKKRMIGREFYPATKAMHRVLVP